MDVLIKVVVLAVLVEAIVETLNMVYEKGQFRYNMLISLAVGITITVAVGVDILEILELPADVLYIGEVLTGIIISRGGNFVHELFDKINISNKLNKGQ